MHQEMAGKGALLPAVQKGGCSGCRQAAADAMQDATALSSREGAMTRINLKQLVITNI